MPLPRSASITLVALLLGLPACGDDGTNNPDAGGCAIESTFSSIHANRLSTGTCATAGCHGSAASGGINFSQSKDEVYALLVDADSASSSLRRVETSSRALSFLYVKISDDNAPGGRMPPLGGPLPQCEIEAIGAWIDKGAPND